jgi:hypothetical protein
MQAEAAPNEFTESSGDIVWKRPLTATIKPDILLRMNAGATDIFTS